MGNACGGGVEPGGKRPARDARWRIGCYRGWPGFPYLRQGRGARLVGSRPCGIEPTVRSRRSCERRGCGAGPLDRGENCRNPPCQTGDEPRPKRNRPAISRRADKCRTIRQRADLTVRLVSGSGHRLDWTDSFYNQKKFFSHGSRRREKVKRAYVCRRVPRQVPVGGKSVAKETGEILVADSHPLCREGLTTLFARNLGLSHLIEAWDFPSVIATMGARRSIDLITIDLGLPGMRKREG